MIGKMHKTSMTAKSLPLEQILLRWPLARVIDTSFSPFVAFAVWPGEGSCFKKLGSAVACEKCPLCWDSSRKIEH